MLLQRGSNEGKRKERGESLVSVGCDHRRVPVWKPQLWHMDETVYSDPH